MISYEEWQNRLPSELEYWRWVIESDSFKEEEKLEFRLNPNTEIQEEIKPYITLNSKILDVGCGIATYLGKKYNNTLLNITAVDILADEFNSLLARNNINLPVPIKKGSYEDISYQFFKEHFNLVYSRNSLDHCNNPLKAINNMLHVCKDGGFLFIQVYENEANRCNWEGLHQWNFCLENEKVIFSNNQLRVELEKEIRFPIIYSNKNYRENGVCELTFVISKEIQHGK